jgi:hypothetical protein
MFVDGRATIGRKIGSRRDYLRPSLPEAQWLARGAPVAPRRNGLFLIGRIANFVAAGSLAVGLSGLLLAGTAAGIIWFAMLRRFAVAGAGRW